MTFNEWLLQQYGITSDDLTDEDYDNLHEEWLQWWESRYENCSLAKRGR